LAVLFVYQWIDFLYFRKHFLEFVTTLQIFSLLVAICVAVKGYFSSQKMPSGNMFVDFMFGYEPNPRFFDMMELDPKWFFEGRGLTLWMCICTIWSFVQYENDKHLSVAMLSTLTIHFFYIMHYFNSEPTVLNMKDFTDEHEGWSLIFGMITLVPVLYSMPEFYILENPVQLNIFVAILIIGIFFFGYRIFSEANQQKLDFRSNPKSLIWGKPARMVATKDNRGLLISGWWGIVRKANYTGDLVQCIAYGLPAMAFSIVPFINLIFLFGLLIHRERRDEKSCLAKHENAWTEYCDLVPYRFIPFIY